MAACTLGGVRSWTQSRRHVHAARCVRNIPKFVLVHPAFRFPRSRFAVRSSFQDGAESPAQSTAILQLLDNLRVLETERDDALTAAEAKARQIVKLQEMLTLLDELALRKVKEGDDAGARQVLEEKAAVKEVLEKSEGRAQVNFALAAKLADKIGALQEALVSSMAQGGAGARSSGGSGDAGWAPPPQPQSPPPPPPAAWEVAVQEARQRAAAAEADAARAAAAAAASARASAAEAVAASRQRSAAAAAQSLAQAQARLRAAPAAESISAARERLRAQAWNSVADAQARRSGSAAESIAAARARIAAEDAEALARVRKVVAAYKRGDYVSEEQLEWAFQQLERRFLL